MKNLILFLCMAIIVIACKKKETPPPEEEPQPDPVILRTISNFTVECQNVNYYYATAKMTDGVNASGMNAGKVFVSGLELTGSPNYNYSPTSSTTVLYSPITWSIQGSASVVGTTLTVRDIPSNPTSPDVDTSKTIVGSNGYTINNPAFNCDSIVYTIGNKTKIMPGNCTSVTFSSSDLNGVSYGIGIGGGKTLNVYVSCYNMVKTHLKQNLYWRFVSKSTLYKTLHYTP